MVGSVRPFTIAQVVSWVSLFSNFGVITLHYVIMASFTSVRPKSSTREHPVDVPSGAIGFSEFFPLGEFCYARDRLQGLF